MRYEHEKEMGVWASDVLCVVKARPNTGLIERAEIAAIIIGRHAARLGMTSTDTMRWWLRHFGIVIHHFGLNIAGWRNAGQQHLLRGFWAVRKRGG